MRKYFFFILILLNTPVLLAQNPKVGIDTTYTIYTICESKAEFPGGYQVMNDFIKENCVYPKRAIENGEQGKVWCEFLVSEDGSLSQFKVVKSVSFLLDKEAIRILKLMPNWIPGEVNGVLKETSFIISINFELK